MKLVNLTKQPLVLHDTRGERVELAPDPRHLGVVALGEHRSVEDEDGHVLSVNVRHIREIKGMPDPDPESLYIVPVEVAMVLQAQRDDVLFPAEDAQVPGTSGRPQRVTHLRRVVSRLE